MRNKMKYGVIIMYNCIVFKYVAFIFKSTNTLKVQINKPLARKHRQTNRDNTLTLTQIPDLRANNQIFIRIDIVYVNFKQKRTSPRNKASNSSKSLRGYVDRARPLKSLIGVFVVRVRAPTVKSVHVTNHQRYRIPTFLYPRLHILKFFTYHLT